MYRPIDLETAKEFAKLFGSHVIQRGNRTSVIFQQWEAFNFNQSIMGRAGVANLSAGGALVRGNIEIREIHQSFFAPAQNQKFDLNGFPNYGIPLNKDISQATRPASWVEAMLSGDRISSQSSSSSPNRGRSYTRNSNRSSPYPRPRSSSPLFRTSYQCRRDTSPETSKEQFI